MLLHNVGQITSAQLQSGENKDLLISINYYCEWCWLMSFWFIHAIACAGWFSRDLSTLSRVTKVLLPLPDDIVKQPTQVTIPMDCFQILGSLNDRTYQIINASVAKRFDSE